MLYSDPSQLDLSKYKRLFTFGCSFTKYRWPTWVDILHDSMPNADLYNTAKSGAGQQYIATQLEQHNRHYKFNEDDLIVIMYSTFYREDRYRYCGKGRDNWITPGNIYTQQTYSEDFVKNWADPRGYIIRDLALMTGVKALLEQLPCAAVTMSSVPIDFAYNEYTQQITEIDDVIELHRDVIDSLQKPMLSLEMNGVWTSGATYDMNGQQYADYHPSTVRYCNYLKKIGFDITDESTDYAEQCTHVLDNDIETFDDLVDRWGHEYSLRDNFKPLL